MSEAPDPQTPVRAARLTWTDDGRPSSEAFGDIYFAPDGLAESRTVFLGGCGLPDAWRGRRRFTVAELGFGSGLNILALLQLWRDHRPPGGRLHIFSVEAFPLRVDEAARALAVFPELSELAAPLLRRWPGAVQGFERIDWPELGATLDVANLEVRAALAVWGGRADAWFLDGFAPSRNPDMWRPEVLDLVRARSAPGARLATFTVAGAVRRGLEAGGWTLARRPGHGAKRERLEARLDGPSLGSDGPLRVRILGAGVAGASLARAFSRLSARVTVFDPAPGGGASGNPSALISPRFDAGGGPSARLAAQAFARAATLYRAEAPDAVLAEGVLRLPTSPKDLARWAAVARSGLFRPDGLKLLDAQAATARLGEPAEAALWVPDALAVEPARLLARWLAHAETETEANEAADITCVAAGWGARAWVDRLEAVSGQASWTDRVAAPGAPASWGGYLAPTPGGGVLFGATHARGQAGTAATPEADVKNLETLRSRMPGLAGRLDGAGLRSRAAVRATTPDRLPLAGALDAGYLVLGGLGGRGFTWAPLLAEHVAALALGAPSPLPTDLARLVDPARFQAPADERRLPT